MKLRDPKSIRRAAIAATYVIRGLAHSYRFAYRPLTCYLVNDRPELLGSAQYIYAFWHEHIVIAASVYARADTSVLIGQHADGELITQVTERFGMSVVRGSSTRGGTAATLRMLRNGWGAAAPRNHPGRAQGTTTKMSVRDRLSRLADWLPDRASRIRLQPLLAGPELGSIRRAAAAVTRACVSAHPILVPPNLSTEELKPYQALVEDATEHSHGDCGELGNNRRIRPSRLRATCRSRVFGRNSKRLGRQHV